jgi:hypothetical protein
MPNVRPENLVKIGIGGWQVPRTACKNMVEHRTNIFTMNDLEEMEIEKVVKIALERAWDGCEVVYLSYMTLTRSRQALCLAPYWPWYRRTKMLVAIQTCTYKNKSYTNSLKKQLSCYFT